MNNVWRETYVARREMFKVVRYICESKNEDADVNILDVPVHVYVLIL